MSQLPLPTLNCPQQPSLWRCPQHRRKWRLPRQPFCQMRLPARLRPSQVLRSRRQCRSHQAHQHQHQHQQPTSAPRIDFSQLLRAAEGLTQWRPMLLGFLTLVAAGLLMVPSVPRRHPCRRSVLWQLRAQAQITFAALSDARCKPWLFSVRNAALRMLIRTRFANTVALRYASTRFRSDRLRGGRSVWLWGLKRYCMRRLRWAVCSWLALPLPTLR